jgi:hypothetical protein
VRELGCAARNMPAMNESTSITDWPRPVVHWEIVARGAEHLANFYRQLFNWRIGEGDIKQVPAGLGPRSPPPTDTYALGAILESVCTFRCGTYMNLFP